ncbi:glycosyltransferase family 39 protein [bacterium]|nr:glycosyltransferase family 39 protein [bacterium]
MEYLKKNCILILIFLLAIFLRLNYDIFISGYNFDEIAMVSIAKQKFPFEILNAISKLDYHAPLYYLIIHPFTYLQNEWLYLRLLNLIFSLVNIFVFYKIGKLLNGKKLGYVLALILSVNHLAISTASFIKFYCLYFLLYSTSIYYLIKVIKQNKNHTKFAIMNTLCILSSTFGIVFISIEYLILHLKQKIKPTNAIFIPSIGFLLYLPILIKQIQLNKETIISPHSSYSEFSTLAFYNFFNDYFTPLINYCCNLITIESCTYLANIFKSLQENKIDILALFVFIFLSLIPVILSIFCVLKGIINNKIIKKINIISLVYFVFFIILVILEKTGFIPIYLYPCGLILLITLGVGIVSFKNKKISTAILIYLIFCQLIITNCYPPTKRGIEKAKIYYGIEKYLKNKDKNTYLIATVGGRFIKKYYKNERIIDFDSEKMKGSFNRDFINIIFDGKITPKTNKKSLKDLIKDDILEEKKSVAFENYFNKSIKNQLNKNDKIVLSFYADEYPFIFTQREIENTYSKKYYPHLSKARIKDLASEEIIFDSGYLSEIILTYSFNQLIEQLEKNFKRIKIEQYQKTPNDDYIKAFESYDFDKSTKWIAQNTIKGWVFITYQKMK